MVYWHWNITRDGAIRFSLILLLFSLSYQNFTWLNSHFLPLIPVGYILLGISSVFVLRHIYRTIRWYRIWLNGKRHQKYEKLAIHICLYLVIMSVVLSIPMSIDKGGLFSSSNTIEKDGYSITYNTPINIDNIYATPDYVSLTFKNTNSDTDVFGIAQYSVSNAHILYSDGSSYSTLNKPDDFALQPQEAHITELAFTNIDPTMKPVLYVTVVKTDMNDMPQMMTGSMPNGKVSIIKLY